MTIVCPYVITQDICMSRNLQARPRDNPSALGTARLGWRSWGEAGVAKLCVAGKETTSKDNRQIVGASKPATTGILPLTFHGIEACHSAHSKDGLIVAIAIAENRTSSQCLVYGKSMAFRFSSLTR